MCGLFAFWEYDKSMTKFGGLARTSADGTLRSGRIEKGLFVSKSLARAGLYCNGKAIATVQLFDPRYFYLLG